MNIAWLKKKNVVARKNSISGGRISYAPISKKCLKLPESLSIIYDTIMTMAGFILTFVVFSLFNCLIKSDPPKAISIETPQAA